MIDKKTLSHTYTWRSARETQAPQKAHPWRCRKLGALRLLQRRHLSDQAQPVDVKSNMYDVDQVKVHVNEGKNGMRQGEVFIESTI